MLMVSFSLRLGVMLVGLASSGEQVCWNKLVRWEAEEALALDVAHENFFSFRSGTSMFAKIQNIHSSPL